MEFICKEGGSLEGIRVLTKFRHVQNHGQNPGSHEFPVLFGTLYVDDEMIGFRSLSIRSFQTYRPCYNDGQKSADWTNIHGLAHGFVRVRKSYIIKHRKNPSKPFDWQL